MHLLVTIIILLCAGEPAYDVDYQDTIPAATVAVPTVTSATAAAMAGDNKGEVNCNGAFTVSQITKTSGGTTTTLIKNVDYEIKNGTDGSSKVEITFTDPLARGDLITVTGTTPESQPVTTLTLSQ